MAAIASNGTVLSPQASVDTANLEKKFSISVDSVLVTHDDDSDDGYHSPTLDFAPSPKASIDGHRLALPRKNTQLVNQKSSFHRWSVAIVARIKNQLDSEIISIRTDIQFKLLFTMLLSSSGITAAFLLRDDPAAKYKFIAATMFFILGLFFVSFLYFVFTSRSLHRIEVITARIKPDFGSIIFPIKIKQYPNQPIKSMSELFALRGTSIHLLFGFVCNTIGVLVFLAVLLNWFDIHQNDLENAWNSKHVANFLGICGGIATPLMGNYDLNPNDKGHIAMHYIGVMLMGVSVWSVGIAFEWNMQVIVLISCTMFVLTVWIVLSTFHYPDIIGGGGLSKKAIKARTHHISLVCITAETLGCILCSSCNIMYVWNLRDTDMV
eukprot:202707_1